MLSELEHRLWLYGTVLAWLLILSVLDVKRREVPHWGSTFPFLAIGLLRIVYPPPGQPAWLAGSAILLMLSAVVLSDIPPLYLAFSVTALIIGLQTRHIAVPLLVGTWILSLLWTDWGIWGAADAKVTMILVAIWPDLYLAGSLLLALLLGGLLALYRRYGRVTPVVLFRTFGQWRKGQVPARQSAAQTATLTYQAGMPWLTVGAMIYMVISLWDQG